MQRPGAIYECGCTDLPEGDCDCEGNQLDALGVCGGDCVADADPMAYATIWTTGSARRVRRCNGPGAIYECGCANIPDGDCDCEGNQSDALGVCGGVCAGDANSNGICDSDEIEGCTDSEALNFYDAANVDDGSCVGMGDLPTGWDFKATPISAAFLGNVTVDGIVAEEPTALGAFSESGLCIGWALPITVNGVSYVSLTLYGDDETTEDVDGMLAGEDFSLRIHLIDSETTLEFRQNGTTAFLSGWTNTNGAPMAGYNDPEVTYNFTLLAECSDSTACNYNRQAHPMRNVNILLSATIAMALASSSTNGVCGGSGFWPAIATATATSSTPWRVAVMRSGRRCRRHLRRHRRLRRCLRRVRHLQRPGAIYACGCSDTLKEIDYDGNQLDALACAAVTAQKTPMPMALRRC